jgi:hypothetical protein
VDEGASVDVSVSVCVSVLMVLHHKIYHNLFAVVLDYWTSTILRVDLCVCDATYFGKCMYSCSSLELSGIQMTNHSSKTVICIEQSTWCHVPEEWNL